MMSEVANKTNNMNWIPTSIRFPDYSGDYLVAYSGSKRIAIAYFVDLENTFYNKSSKLEIKTATHWMYLPKAPNN